MLLILLASKCMALASENCSEQLNRKCLQMELRQIIDNRFNTVAGNYSLQAEHWPAILMALGDEDRKKVLSQPGMESLQASFLTYKKALNAIDSQNSDQILLFTKKIEQPYLREMALTQWLNRSHKTKGFSYLMKQLGQIKSELGYRDWWKSANYCYYLSVKWVQLETAEEIERELIQSALAQSEQKNSMILDVVYAALIGGDATKARLLMKNMQLSGDQAILLAKQREAYLDLADLLEAIQKNNLAHKAATNFSELMSEWEISLADEQRERLRKIAGEMSDELRFNRHIYIVELLQSRYRWFLFSEDQFQALTSLVYIHLSYAYQIAGSINESAYSSQRLDRKAYWLALLISYLS